MAVRKLLGGNLFEVFNTEWNVKLNTFNMCSLHNKDPMLQKIGRVDWFLLQKNRFLTGFY